MSDLDDDRMAALDAIDRRRDESSVAIPSRTDLAQASARALRRAASAIRGAAWADKSTSAEEGAEIVDDPGWAPNAALRAAALIDHLSELSLPLGNELAVPAAAPGAAAAVPAAPTTPWTRISVSDLRRQLNEMTGTAAVSVFDGMGNVCIARATSWRGEIVEIRELDTLQQRIATQKQILQGSADAGAKKAAKEEIGRLESKPAALADALVRSGYTRPRFGADLTSDLFRQHVVGRKRLDIAVDVNAIAHGLVSHLARLVPRIDFSRAAITDLEIQRLADHDRVTWRKSCRVLESFPVEGPAWRSLGQPDATALLVARAEQGGEKAAGADALFAHNFEEGLRRGYGVRSVLLTTDNGLARTVAARLPEGTVWVAYVDALLSEDRFFSPLLAWPKDLISESRYSSLTDLLDDLLVCNATESILATDGSTTLEIRGHLEGEHQYGADWRVPHLFVRGLAGVGPSGIVPPVPAQRTWPLGQLPKAPVGRPSGARITLEQSAVVLEWFRQSIGETVNRDDVPLAGDARNEAWTFLRAIGLIDDRGAATGRTELVSATTRRQTDRLRSLILRFEPVVKIVTAVERGARTSASARDRSGLGERTFGAALGLSTGAGLVWRDGEALGLGNGFVERDTFRAWLLAAIGGSQARVSRLAERAARDLNLSPVRFKEALSSLLDDATLVGIRGGSAEAHGMDSRVLGLTEDGRIVVEQLMIDDILGLRSLAVRQ